MTEISSTSGMAAPEYNVKAGYILLFARYTTWPPTAFTTGDSPVVVGVLGKDPFGKVLDETFLNARVQGRRLEIRRIADAQEAKPCHLVFIGGEEESQLAQWLKDLGDKPILTVTETNGALDHGAMINFAMEGNRIRFEVNLAAVGAAGLKIATPMLVSAKRIQPDNTSKRAGQ